MSPQVPRLVYGSHEVLWQEIRSAFERGEGQFCFAPELVHGGFNIVNQIWSAFPEVADIRDVDGQIELVFGNRE